MDELLRKNYSAPGVIFISSQSKSQFFVAAEKEILGEYPCFQNAPFFCFAAFHVEYPPQLKNILYYIQDFKLLSDTLIPSIEVVLTCNT